MTAISTLLPWSVAVLEYCVNFTAGAHIAHLIKFLYYAGIMLNASANLLWSKLCWYKLVIVTQIFNFTLGPLNFWAALYRSETNQFDEMGI